MIMTESLSKIKKICDILFHITDMDIELYDSDLNEILIFEHLSYPKSLSKFYSNYYKDMYTNLSSFDNNVCFLHEVRDFSVLSLDIRIYVSQEESYYVCVGPVLTRPYSSQLILDVLNRHSLPLSAKDAVSAYYLRMPFFSPKAKNTFWMCYHLLTTLPEPNYMNLLSSSRLITEGNPSDMSDFQEEPLIQKSSIYMNYELEALWRTSITHGDMKASQTALTRMAGNDFSYRTPTEPLRTYKNMLVSLNALARGAATDANVDALRIHQLHEHYAFQIESAAHTLDIENIENQISSDYCNLVISSKTTGYSLKVTKAIEYIYANYDAPINLSSAAQEVGCSKEHLSRVFHTETGKTFTSYLNKLRIEYAASILTASSISITDIALMVGFSSYTKFSIEFKKHTGLSASEYKKEHTQMTGNLR